MDYEFKMKTNTERTKVEDLFSYEGCKVKIFIIVNINNVKKSFPGWERNLWTCL